MLILSSTRKHKIHRYIINHIIILTHFEKKKTRLKMFEKLTAKKKVYSTIT